MLIKCKECQKDVSSEASNCPNCGFPIKSPPKIEEVPIVREVNSSKSGLGTFFIVLAIIGVIIGFIVVQPSDVEGLQQKVVNMGHQYDLPDNGHKDELDSTIANRHFEAGCFFIPSGILLVLGLVLKSSAKPNA
jgi:hypothetical protein